MPEYDVKIKFHIFPYRKFNISAKNEAEARKIAKEQAHQLINTLEFTISSIKAKQFILDEYL